MRHHRSGLSVATAAPYDEAGVAVIDPIGGDIGPYGVPLTVAEFPAYDVPFTAYIEVTVNV